MRIVHKFCMGLVALMGVAGLTLATPALADEDDWFAPVKPFRIAGNIFYVGTRGLAAYLIVTDKGAILIDPTAKRNAPLIERSIESLGVPLKSVKILLADHAHEDHVGAMAALRRDTGARLLASAGDRWALEHGVPRGDTDYGVRRFPPVTVDGVVADGQAVRLGDTVLVAHLTPGHTPGCTSWSTTVDEGGTPRRVLFLCSITVAGNLLTGNRAYPGIVADFRRTFARLEGMKADILLTSHPDAAGLFGRKARAADGAEDAFVDRKALPALVASSKRAFEAELRAVRRGKGRK